MGGNMALRLHDCGYQVTALYDTYAPSAQTIAAQIPKAVAATSLAQCTSLADVVITVVSDDRAMEHIFAHDGDSLLDGAAGKVFINCATVTPQVHVEVEHRAKAAGAKSLEACMASSITQAREGTLYLMIGGERAAFEQVKPLLEALGSTVRYIGPAGTAAQVKALVNMVMNSNTAALAEGLGLGEALGLDLSMLRDVFSQTGANSRVLETDGADMQAREHDVYFSAEHAAKDSGIALALGRNAGITLPVAQAAYEQYERMKSLGLGQLDKSGVAELTFAGRHAKMAQ